MSQTVRGAAFAALLLLLAVVPAGRTAFAASPALALAGELDVNSHYVWRGIAYSRGMVVNPSATATWGGWSLNAWGNLDRDPRAAHALNEVDLTLGWSTEVLGLGFEPALLAYTYPASPAPATAELQLVVRRAVAGPVSAFTRQSVEVAEVRGASWSDLGLECEAPAGPHVSLHATAAYGRGWWRFASAYADRSLEGLDLASAGLAATIAPPGAAFTIRPHADWYGVGNAGVKDWLTGSSPWVVGVALSGPIAGRP